MTILTIIQPDNPILRQKAKRVNNFDQSLQTLIDDMYETMINAEGVGLAAPQIAKSMRLILVRLPDDEDSKDEYGEDAGKLYVVANPKIIKHSNHKIIDIEGCLSLPGLLGDVERYESIVITGQDQQGNPLRLKCKGWLARVFQHEIDHLDGQLFIDIAEKVWRPTDEETEEVTEA